MEENLLLHCLPTPAGTSAVEQVRLYVSVFVPVSLQVSLQSWSRVPVQLYNGGFP